MTTVLTRFRRLVLAAVLTLLFATLLLSFPAAAQSSVQIERMQINIWPEYDRR